MTRRRKSPSAAWSTWKFQKRMNRVNTYRNPDTRDHTVYDDQGKRRPGNVTLILRRNER